MRSAEAGKQLTAACDVDRCQYNYCQQVKVEIVDVNDNSPVFPERHISHEISELAEPGTALVTSDLDLD